MNIILIALLFSTFTPITGAETWDESNDPSIFDKTYEYNLNLLPIQGEVPIEVRPWSGSYWPRNKGSINFRWNANPQIGFDYRSPSKESVLVMTREELMTLAPTEKYDLALGHYHYPFTKGIAAFAKKKAKDFEGLCDGWTASALQFPEPKPHDITNPDGLVIPFGSADIKALMSYSAAEEELKPIFVGTYCLSEFGIRLNSSRCSDINAGAYHVILANELGIKKTPFAADISIGHETWNQPVYGFEFEIVGSALTNNKANEHFEMSKKAVKAYEIHAKMHYAEDDVPGVSTWEAALGTDQYMSGTQEVRYILELNAQDKIIGGSWITKGTHPDLFWKPTQKIEFKGDFEIINELLKN